MFKTVFAATAALVITAIPAQAQTCTRDGLKAIVANYFKALRHTTCPRWRQPRTSALPRMDRRSSWAKVFSKPEVSRNFNAPLSTRNAAARSHRPSLMKLRIPTRRPPPDGEEQHAEQRPVEAQVEVEAQRLVRLEPESAAWRRWRWCACSCARWFTCCGPLHRSRGHSCSATQS
jgi:hypothetical protein